jgi:hypothetical protein
MVQRDTIPQKSRVKDLRLKSKGKNERQLGTLAICISLKGTEERYRMGSPKPRHH